MTIQRALPWLLVVTGSVGFLASATLMIERVRLLEDPTYLPMCSLNATFSCGSVMTSAQASVFGFPNPLLGIAGFAMVLTIGMGMLAGATFARWFWWGAQVGAAFAIVFVHWLIFQTVFRIEALCPYCMVVWAVTWPIFLYITLRNLQKDHAGEKAPAVSKIQQYHSSLLLAWYLAIALLVLWRFWG